MKTILIGEIGENHFGNWDLCGGMVKELARGGATFAKFQTYTAEQFGRDHMWYEDFKRTEMPPEVHVRMQALCRELGIGFLCSTFTVRSTKFLVDKLGCDSLKLASSRVTDLKLLDDVNSRSDRVKTVYLSTGMSTMEEVKGAVGRLGDIETVYLLHCTSQYPAEDQNVNLLSIPALEEAFPGHPVGYSDHSRGLEACVAAVVLGAVVLEKHFTYSTSMPGDDHEGALTPETLPDLVRRVERVETMMGSKEKKPLPAETKAHEGLRVEMREVGFED